MPIKMCAHIWVLNTQSLQLWYSSLKKKKVSDTSAQTMKSKRIFMIYIWSCVWQVFFAGFLFVDSSGCFHTCFVFLFFLAVCPVSISLKWSVVFNKILVALSRIFPLKQIKLMLVDTVLRLLEGVSRHPLSRWGVLCIF